MFSFSFSNSFQLNTTKMPIKRIRIVPELLMNSYRTFSSYESSNSMIVFDEKVKKIQRERGYIRARQSNSSGYDCIREEIALRLVDRLLGDIASHWEFSTIANIGWDGGYIERELDNLSIHNSRIRQFLQIDTSSRLLNASKELANKRSTLISKNRLLLDQENDGLLLETNSLDGIISNLQWHFVNDLPGLLKQSYEALKPEGVLLASLFGGQTLFELRSALQLAEMEREGGFAPHVSPFAGKFDKAHSLDGWTTRKGTTISMSVDQWSDFGTYL